MAESLPLAPLDLTALLQHVLQDHLTASEDFIHPRNQQQQMENTYSKLTASWQQDDRVPSIKTVHGRSPKTSRPNAQGVR